MVITTTGASELIVLSPVSRPDVRRPEPRHQVAELLVRQRLQRRRVEGLAAHRAAPARSRTRPPRSCRSPWARRPAPTRPASRAAIAVAWNSSSGNGYCAAKLWGSVTVLRVYGRARRAARIAAQARPQRARCGAERARRTRPAPRGSTGARRRAIVSELRSRDRRGHRRRHRGRDQAVAVGGDDERRDVDRGELAASGRAARPSRARPPRSPRPAGRRSSRARAPAGIRRRVLAQERRRRADQEPAALVAQALGERAAARGTPRAGRPRRACSPGRGPRPAPARAPRSAKPRSRPSRARTRPRGPRRRRPAPRGSAGRRRPSS